MISTTTVDINFEGSWALEFLGFCCYYSCLRAPNQRIEPWESPWRDLRRIFRLCFRSSFEHHGTYKTYVTYISHAHREINVCLSKRAMLIHMENIIYSKLKEINICLSFSGNSISLCLRISYSFNMWNIKNDDAESGDTNKECGVYAFLSIIVSYNQRHYVALLRSCY